MLTFTLPLAKPLECIKSCIHSRPMFQAPAFLSLPPCAELQRERQNKGQWRGSPSREALKQGTACSGWYLESVRRLCVLSAKCRHTLTSFNWRWRCFTVLINGQRTKNTKLLLFLKGDKGRQMEDGGGDPSSLPSTPRLSLFSVSHCCLPQCLMIWSEYGARYFH